MYYHLILLILGLQNTPAPKVYQMYVLPRKVIFAVHTSTSGVALVRELVLALGAAKTL